MIEIHAKEECLIHNFWNHCLFHPTDAVEDPWGKRILDRMAKDGSIKSVRIYAMLEDIVYLDGEDNLAFDFRLSDLRLDYLIEKGYSPLIAYAGMPDCIAERTQGAESNSKNKTRYKGKLFNTNLPYDFALWEEVCYRYTMHNIERYGIEAMADWRLTCFNEPDAKGFFLSSVPNEDIKTRVEAYATLYEAFSRGVRRASDRLKIGGPATCGSFDFFDDFLKEAAKRKLDLDFLAIHNYGTWPDALNSGEHKINVANNMQKQEKYLDIITKNGFADVPIVVDEWGACSRGFHNKEECPALMFRETEVFASYYTKLIQQCLERKFKIDRMMICLSGQHEMVEDFSGFRNFFTLNFIDKPIYNAYLMASKLGDTLLSCKTDDDNLFVIPTKLEDGSYAVMLTYATDTFEESLPTLEETILLPEDAVGKKITVYLIDRTHTNPYRLAERTGIGAQPTKEEIALLRKEGMLSPVAECTVTDRQISLHLEANATVLFTLE